MFNLLSKNIKKNIKSEYRLRLLVVSLVFFLVLQVLVLFAVFPSWLISTYKEDELTTQLEVIKGSRMAQEADPVASDIRVVNTKLNILNIVLEYPEVKPIVDTILANKSKDVHITEISYSTVGTTTSLAVSGISDTRESLVSYVKRLDSSNSFSTVNLPVSNLAKDKNINFTIGMTVKK